jgi:nucleoside-diphosphate-sugar epimerase
LRLFGDGLRRIYREQFDRPVARRHPRVVGHDDFSLGRPAFLETATRSDHAANADVRFGMDHPRTDLEQNTIVTMNVLEAIGTNAIRDIAFSSTGSIYGEAGIFPTPENAPIPVQTSLMEHQKSQPREAFAHFPRRGRYRFTVLLPVTWRICNLRGD